MSNKNDIWKTFFKFDWKKNEIYMKVTFENDSCFLKVLKNVSLDVIK